MSIEPTITTEEETTLQPCDRCERILWCKLFAVFYFCPQCLDISVKAIGLEAAGRAIERLSRLQQAQDDLKQTINQQDKRIRELLAMFDPEEAA